MTCTGRTSNLNALAKVRPDSEMLQTQFLCGAGQVWTSTGSNLMQTVVTRESLHSCGRWWFPLLSQLWCRTERAVSQHLHSDCSLIAQPSLGGTPTHLSVVQAHSLRGVWKRHTSVLRARWVDLPVSPTQAGNSLFLHTRCLGKARRQLVYGQFQRGATGCEHRQPDK